MTAVSVRMCRDIHNNICMHACMAFYHVATYAKMWRGQTPNCIDL